MLYIPNETHEFLLFFDTEFDKQKVVQFAGNLYKKEGENIYLLIGKINTYIDVTVSYPFYLYTGISNSFLAENGIKIEDAKSLIRDFFKDVDLEKTLLVSHGFSNDSKILLDNGILFPINYEKNKAVEHYCTFEHARSILNRTNELKLEDLCYESATYPYNEHNAARDADLTLSVFEYLKELE